MTTECPYCRQRYDVDDSYFGTVVSCETCKRDFTVDNMDEQYIVSDSDKEYVNNKADSSKSTIVPIFLLGALFVVVVIVCAFVIMKMHGRMNDYALQNAKLQANVEQLTQQKDELQAKIDDLVFGPETMLQNALAAYETSDFEGAKKIIVQLFDRYPGKRVTKKYLEAYDKITIACEKQLAEKAENEAKERAEKAEKEAKRRAEKEEKEAKALVNISKKYDLMQETTWYETSRNCEKELSKFKYVDAPNKYYSISLYFGKKDNGTFLLRLRTSFYDATESYNWVFYDRVQLKGDNGVNIYIETKYPEKDSEVGDGSVREWSDNYVGDKAIDFIKLAKADIIYVKFYGKYPYEFVMTDEQICAFKEILTLYESMRFFEEDDVDDNASNPFM